MKKINYKIVSLFVLVMSVMFIASPAFAEAGKIGHINLSSVFDAYKKTKDYDKKLELEAEEKRTSRGNLVKDIKQLRDEIELLSEKKRVEKQSAIDLKVRELQSFDRDARQTLRQERDTMLKEILKEIDRVVKEFGDEAGYEYILDGRLLLYKNESTDLSQEIINRLNAKY